VRALRWRDLDTDTDRLARDDALIFGDLDGRHLHPERFSRRIASGWTGAAAPSRLPAIRLHDLRVALSAQHWQMPVSQRLSGRKSQDGVCL
jgi:hypothetical protein